MKITVITLGTIGALTCSGLASTTLVNQLKINFDGTLVGTVYSLGAGEVDTTGTFMASGAPVVGGGVATVSGGSDGFEIDATPLNDLGTGDLTPINWVAEMVVTLNSTTGTIPTLIDVQGDTDVRINGGFLEASYWDGASQNPTSTLIPDLGTQFVVAMVWDAANTTLTGYMDGAAFILDPPADGGAFAAPDPANISFGFFGRAGFDNRGIDGVIDAVAFSTFTGSFDPQTDLQLSVVPEPSSTALLGLGGLALIMRRRK